MTTRYDAVAVRRYKDRDGNEKSQFTTIGTAWPNPAAVSELISTLESLQCENENLRKDKDHISAEKAGIAKNAYNNVDYWKSQAEAAEAEVKLIREAVGELLDQAEHVCLGAHTPLDIKEAARNLADPIAKVHTALASTGGEHNGN